jgi:hypothetical protein
LIVGADSAAYGSRVEVVANTSGEGIRIRGRTSDGLGTVSFGVNAAATEYARITGDNTSSLQFGTGSSGTERMRIDSSGRLLIGGTTTYDFNGQSNLVVNGTANNSTITIASTAVGYLAFADGTAGTQAYVGRISYDHTSNYMDFWTNGTEKMRIDSSGNLLVGKTGSDAGSVGVELRPDGIATFTRSGNSVLYVNRLVSDGTLVEFAQATTIEGTISVSGTTVSYNGGHLSRYAQTATVKDESLVKGTVLSNLDEMNVYTDSEGNPVANEQLNKVKVSDVEGDANVAGVFVNWSHDDAHDVDEINMAMTGDMIIRIAQGTTVQRGDLLMSAGDGTAKPQGDDIVRSKTVAKVTSTHVTCTYADGSFCVPCVLMAC